MFRLVRRDVWSIRPLLAAVTLALYGVVMAVDGVALKQAVNARRDRGRSYCASLPLPEAFACSPCGSRPDFV